MAIARERLYKVVLKMKTRDIVSMSDMTQDQANRVVISFRRKGEADLILENTLQERLYIDKEHILYVKAKPLPPVISSSDSRVLIKAFNIKPFIDGNQWSYLLGDDLQTGIAGFGDSQALAITDFNKNFKEHYLKLLESQL